jgi:hypothetical protein
LVRQLCYTLDRVGAAGTVLLLLRELPVLPLLSQL